MSAEDAVMVAANARQEVRRSLDRMEYHLGRGQRGVRGVKREVDFLDALSRQAARVGQATAGTTRLAGGDQLLGRKAQAALSSGNSAAIGRTKSSLLAGFSDDVMWGAREWTYRDSVGWIWQTNGSACVTCLANHGHVFHGYFSPEHPSCLCFPEDVSRAAARGVEPLNDSQLLNIMMTSNNPRWREQGRLVQDGFWSLSDAIDANRRPNTKARYEQQALARLVRGGVQPAPRVIQRTTPAASEET